MPGKSITINEALIWQKTLSARHSELVSLRNQNSHETKHFFGANADKERLVTPLYDVILLDKAITTLAREIRMLDQALKGTNAVTPVINYFQDDAVLGELVPAEKK
jgi:hypothetical protein